MISGKRIIVLFPITIISLLISIISPVQGQTPGPFTTLQVIPPSPNASSLGVYGDVPVSQYAGLPDISIPIYGLSENDIKLPISLSYHGGGVKIREQAGWVGLGWALNAGGIITRAVRDKDDLSGSTQYFNSQFPITDSYGAVAPIYCTIGESGTEQGPYYSYFTNYSQESPHYDFQPDIFYYNFAGYSGKFIIDQAAQFHVIGKQENIEISFIDPLQKNNGFKIRTPDGFQYYFNSGGATANVFSSNSGSSGSGNSTLNYNSTWSLGKIVSPKGNEINFEYSYNQTTSQFFNSVVLNAGSTIVWNDPCFGEPTTFEALDQICNGPIVNQNSTTTTSNEYLLSKIIFSNGYIQFYASKTRTDVVYNGVSAYKLDSIIVFNNKNAQLHKYSLDYDYFVSTGYPVVNSLKLTSVTEQGRPPYTFEYNNHKIGSLSQYGDPWGYSDFLEVQDTNFLISPRENFTKTFKSGMLEKINYPTGGYTSLEYESNTFYEDGINYSQPYVEVKAERYDSAAYHLNTAPQSITIEGATPSYVMIEFQLRRANGSNFSGYPQAQNFYISFAGTTYPFTSIYGDEKVHYAMISLKPGTKTITINVPGGVDIYAYMRVRYYKEKFGGGVRIKQVISNDNAANSISKLYVYGKETQQTIDGASKNVEGEPFGRQISYIKYTRHYASAPSLGCACSRDETYSESVVPLGTSSFGSNIGYDSVIVYQNLNKQGGKTITSYINTPDYPLGLAYPGLPNISNPSNGFLVSEKMYDDGQKLLKETNNTYLLKQRKAFNGDLIVADPFAIQTWKFNGSSDECGLGASCGNGSFFVYPIIMFADWFVLQNKKEKVYDQNIPGNFIETSASYAYDDTVHKLPTSVTTISSKGDTITKYNLYPADYTDNVGFISALKSAFIHNAPVETVTTRTTSSGIKTIIDGKLIKYKNSSAGLPEEYKIIETTTPLALNSFKFSNQISAGILPFSGMSTSFSSDATYKSSILFDRYDNNGNIIQQHKVNDAIIFYIWDYKKAYPIASVINTNSDTTAYTSFEADGNGNWIVSSSTRDSTTIAVTGNKSYILSNGDISKSGLTASKKYIISYWTTNASAYSIAGTVANYPVQGKTIGSWTYFEHKITGQTSVSVSGTGNIDELRLYPDSAQMTTYTYDPLVGMTSQCDLNNKITYYEYDGLQRLKVIRDQDKNIIKNFQYNYASGCGPNCAVLPMQTFNNSNTISYPVGVFNVNGKLLGNATNQTQYISLWNADTADQHRGILVAGIDSMHFNLTINSGVTSIPNSVTGCRYFQYDLSYNKIDGIRNGNAAYVDFGDGTGFFPGKNPNDTAGIILPPNTYIYIIGIPYFIHTYPDNTQKTLTFYHNDGNEFSGLDNGQNPATSLTLVKNVRGNYPQNMLVVQGSCYQQSSAQTIAAVTNWNSINTITDFTPGNGDGSNPCKNLNYPQDFMQNNRGLTKIITAWYGPTRTGYRDTTFKISRLKTDWNTYFTQLQSIIINDDHWNRENLSALKQLNTFGLSSTTQNHEDDPNSPLVPIPSSVVDNAINQIASGAGQTIKNGLINIGNAGTTRTSASDTSVTFLKSKGWTVIVNGITQ